MGNVKIISSFLGGFTLGSCLTYIISKKRCEQHNQHEINEYRKAIVKANHAVQTKKREIAENENLIEQTAESSIANPAINSSQCTEPKTKNMFTQKVIDDYIDYSKQYSSSPDTDVNDKESKPVSGPYPIDPEEYGSMPNYEQIHLTYYKDGIVADDDNNIIEGYKISEMIGNDFKTCFGEYSDDAAWMRNDDTQCEYEIEKSMEPFYGG